VVCGRSAGGHLSVDGRGGAVWSGELSRNTAGFGYSENQVTIALDTVSAGGGKTEPSQPVKEVPLWMSQSTVETAADRPPPQPQVPLCTTAWTDLSIS